MIVQEPVQAAIWHCLNHYAYADATFLAERLYAEVDSDDSLHLLATCYYRAGKTARAYAILQSKACNSSQCKYLLARCCYDLNKLAEAESALTGGTVLKMKTPEDVVNEFADTACFAVQLLARVCGKTERYTKAAEAYRKSLKLNPFLWSSFEALCTMGEKPDASKIFQVGHLDNFNTCQGTNLLLQFVNQLQGSSSSNECTPDTQEFINENSITPANPVPAVVFNNTAVVIRSNPDQLVMAASDDITPENNLLSRHHSGLPMRDLRVPKIRPCGPRYIFKTPISNSPCSPSFGMLPLETPSPDEIQPQYSLSYITSSPATLIDSQGPDPKIGPKKPSFTRRGQALNPTKPPVFGQCGNTNCNNMPNLNVVVGTQPSAPQTGLQTGTIANVPRRSSRLFSSSNSVKENNKSSSKARFTSPKAPTRKTKARSTKNTIAQSAFNELNELNKPETISVESKSSTGGGCGGAIIGCNVGSNLPCAQQAVNVQKAAADGLMLLMQEIGVAYLDLAQYNCRKSIELFSNLAPHHYNTGWVLANVGRAYFELAEYAQASRYFTEVRRLEPYRMEGMEYNSTTLWHQQKEMALSSLARELSEFDKESPEAWCATGNCFSLQKEHDIAIKFFQRAVQVDPNFAYAYTLLGHEYVMTEELDRAMSCFRNAIRIDPRHYNAWYGVGMIYYKQEKFQLAEVHFKRALAINPQSSILMCHIGVVQHALQKMESALCTLNRAIAVDPRNPLCKFHRASIYFANDRHQDALRELEELKEIVPKESLVYFLIGKVHKKLGNTHLALMNFSWAMDLDPKGANNQIKEAIDRRYANDDDEPSLSVNNEPALEEVPIADAEALDRESSHESSVIDNEDMQLQAMESDESL